MLKISKWRITYPVHVLAAFLIPGREGVPVWLAYLIVASLPVAIIGTLIYRKVTNQDVDSEVTAEAMSPLKRKLLWVWLAIMAGGALYYAYFVLVVMPQLE